MLGGWKETVKRQVILAPGRFDPRSIGLLKTPVPLSDFSKLNILTSFHGFSVPLLLPILLLAYSSWLMSLVDILQGTAILSYWSSDQYW